MDIKDIVEMLKSFGLGDYEAKVYCAMIFLGHSKASEISKESKVPQSKIYEVLDKLVEKRLVEIYAVRPKEFRVIAPEVMLKNLMGEKEREINEMKGRIDLLLSSIKRSIPNTEIIEGVWTSRERGWRDFIDRLCDMWNRSEKYAYVITRDFTWSLKLAESVKSCIKRGIEIRTIAIGEIDESTYYRAKWFYDHGVKIKVFKTKVHPRIIDIDGKEILLRLDTNPTKKIGFGFTSIWSKDVSLAKVIDSYVKNTWKVSKAINFNKIPKSENLDKSLNDD